MKKIILWIALVNGIFALGFGSMGNTSAGLGNSGVALRKSAWGIYYNPALLASDNRGKFGYSAGVGAQGLDPLLFDFMPNQMPQNHIYLNSENGIAIQITGGTREIPVLNERGEPTGEMVEQRSSNGAFGIGSFLSIHIDGQLKDIDKPTISNFILYEAPIAWGWRFETNGGDLSIGVSFKHMGASSLHLKSLMNQHFDSAIIKNLNFNNAFGIDLGILYSPTSNLHFGLVAKNINAPSFDLGKQVLEILPQPRFGISYEFADYFALTFDADLMANHISFEDSPKTQTLGGGLLIDFGFFDFRTGIMADLENIQQGPIITGGINLFGFLDLAVQSSLKTKEIRQRKVPETFAIKAGGSFTF